MVPISTNMYHLILSGKSALNVVFQSPILRVHQGHRIKNAEYSKTSLNGDDVSLLMRDITLIWKLVLQVPFLKQEFTTHMLAINPEHQVTLLHGGFDVTKPESGILNVNQLTLKLLIW
jgi:hypothetical protein